MPGARPHTLRRCPRARLGALAKARLAACSDSNFSLPPSGAASRVLSEVEPGGGTEHGRRFRWRREVAAFGGTLAECPCERLERLPRCKWGFSSVMRRLGNVSGSTSVAPTSSPHDRRFSGTRSLSCTVCARRTPTGEVRAGKRVWAAG